MMRRSPVVSMEIRYNDIDAPTPPERREDVDSAAADDDLLAEWDQRDKREMRLWTTRMIEGAAVAAVALPAFIAVAAAQDVTAGETSFKKCLPCHAAGPGATNKVGPVLNGLEGRKSGSVAGYGYSDANRSSGLTWDEATFKDYIKDPRGKVPGTKMIFVGIRNAKEIDDLWAYLRQFNADGTIKPR